MATQTPSPQEMPPAGQASAERGAATKEPASLPDKEPAMQGRLAAPAAFWKKINNDWIFNLAGLLAYNFLLTLFPVLLLLLAGVGALIGLINTDAQLKLELAIASALPGTIGALLVREILDNLQGSVSLLLIVGLIGAFVAGSRLFITLENCFGIIFRLRGRNIIQQNLMAVGMLLLYLLLVPVVFLGSLLPTLLLTFLPPGTLEVAPRWLNNFAQPLVAFVVTTFVVGMTYAFVPHRPMHWRSWRENWKGAVVAAVLLLLYEAFFPWYREHFVHTENYGSLGAFAIIILLFFYYLGLILLLGAEINSWAAGQRETAADIPGILHAVQAHHSLEDAAGPTAGMPHEEMQHHRPAFLRRVGSAIWHRFRPADGEE
ncbi:MAG TPA: YhjD/YihY/BrkB family envelope integrity protein [Ktedonobacterales bacterium]|jgi:membrane protein|nr:YhjD/YihY/BrkB family envelope integrity protein [Ktedonobacterales bacterium]